VCNRGTHGANASGNLTGAHVKCLEKVEGVSWYVMLSEAKHLWR